MGKLFGTDGIRGKANSYPITPEISVKTGRAVAKYFGSMGDGIIIGRDTRISGTMIESAIISGITSMGVDVYRANVVPTPAVAVLAGKNKRCCGIVISASHNPYYDNGIKLFKNDGFKLTDDEENDIEKLILGDELEKEAEKITKPGRIFDEVSSCDTYIDFLLKTMTDMDFNNLKIVLDCSNGATSEVAQKLFPRICQNSKIIFASPDGININDNCGSQHTEFLKKEVIENKADLGLAFDGDGDRLIALDSEGIEVTGDQIIAILAKNMKEEGILKNNTVVTTVMSNIGFVSAMKELDIKHIMAGVGDRFVLADMLKNDAVLGGEDSGHMIFLDCHTTGDGVLSALKLLHVIKKSGKSLKELSKVMGIFPQILINVDVSSKPDVYEIPEISDAIKEVETELGDKGRVLVRYSGTQPMLRVMVEGPTEETTKDCCERIAKVVEEVIGIK